MLILASQSKARQDMLVAAGLQFHSVKPDLDETLVKSNHPELDAHSLARMLAKEKALSVSNQQPETWVIGSDQTLQCENQQFSKPGTIKVARSQLETLRGKTHQLHSAVAIASQGQIIWSACESASLTMRSFSDSFLDAYLKAEVPHILSCVGSYRLESMGIQLFEQVTGSHYTILGMPLLPLLQSLRQHGLIET